MLSLNYQLPGQLPQLSGEADSEEIQCKVEMEGVESNIKIVALGATERIG